MSCNICVEECGTHEVISCYEDLRKGGISAIGLLECDHTITSFSNATQWDTNIASGKAHILKRILGAIPAPAPVEVPSPVGCGPRQITETFDRTVTFTDSNVTADNNAFYDCLNNRTFEGLVIYHCEDDEISYVNLTDFTVTALDETPEDNAQLRSYKVTIKWRKKAMPTITTAPTGIFS